MATAGPHTLLPPDVVLLTIEGYPELQAILTLLLSKQDMQTIANDLKMAWRQDLRMVKSDLSALQNRVQNL